MTIPSAKSQRLVIEEGLFSEENLFCFSKQNKSILSHKGFLKVINIRITDYKSKT